MDKTFKSLSGSMQQETAELDEATVGQTISTTSKPTTKRLQQPRLASSATNSPIPSRESSPVRPPIRATSASTRSIGPGRSRKNSANDVSPSRSTSANANPPSAAAQQRALSATTTPTL